MGNSPSNPIQSESSANLDQKSQLPRKGNWFVTLLTESVAATQTAYDDLRRKKTWESSLLLAIFLVLIAGFVFSLEPYWELLPEFGRTPVVLGLLVLLLLLIRHIYPERPRRTQTNLRPPIPRKGLILMLSPYNKIPKGLVASLKQEDENRENVSEEEYAVLSIPKRLRDLDSMLDDPVVSDDDIRARLLATNWGPLVVAVQYHLPVLQHVWILATHGPRGSFSQVRVAKKLVERLGAAVKLQCHIPDDESHPQCIEVPDNIEEVVEAVRYVMRRRLSAKNIEQGDAIADLTSGLATMTAGMILSAVDSQRPLQYLRQDKPLFEHTGADPSSPLNKRIRALTPDLILKEEVLVEVVTSYHLLDPPES